MTWRRDRFERRGRDRDDTGAQERRWTLADQHRFEDRVDRQFEARDKRLDAHDHELDKLSTRMAWIAGAVALALAVAGVVVRLVTS